MTLLEDRNRALHWARDHRIISTEVGHLLRQAATTFALPGYGNVNLSSIVTKSPGERVSSFDLRVEWWLGRKLKRLIPRSRMLGEEGSSIGRYSSRRLVGYVWIVDPIDGTENYISGAGPFTISVALSLHGRLVAAWIYEPLRRKIWSAIANRGAFLDGRPIRLPKQSPLETTLCGVIENRIMPNSLRQSLLISYSGKGTAIKGIGCASFEYIRMIEGENNFAFFWRALPWDHAPGALILREAGGCALDVMRRPYKPSMERNLLISTNSAIWNRIHSLLFADHP